MDDRVKQRFKQEIIAICGWVLLLLWVQFMGVLPTFRDIALWYGIALGEEGAIAEPLATIIGIAIYMVMYVLVRVVSTLIAGYRSRFSRSPESH